MKPFSATLPIASFAALTLDSGIALEPPKPLTGTVEYKSGVIGGQERHYIIYVPRNLQPKPPILFAFHGGGGDGPIMREGTGFEFDMLADANGFIVIYPYGIGQSWTTCRKGTVNKATQSRADDVTFVESMIAHEVEVRNADRSRVYLTGHSNGGQLSFKLALEHPEFARKRQHELRAGKSADTGDDDERDRRSGGALPRRSDGWGHPDPR